MFPRMRNLPALVAAVILCIPVSLAANQDSLESLMWDLVSDSEDVAKIEAFIESYPDSEFVIDARATLQTLRDRDAGYNLEDSIFQATGGVSFDIPMSFGNEYVIGRTLAEIIESSPAFPPVEGIPDEMWRNQSCKSCHTWTREALCTQANMYISMEPSKYREKQHPFDGMLKINLRNWAQNDCQ